MSASLDCQSCGACCVEAGAVRVRSDDETPADLTRLVENGCYHMVREIGGRCIALRGEIGAAVRCSIYERRPEVCRAFEPGSEGCAAARERMAWKLSRMDWKPHGYGPDERVNAA